MDAVLEETGTRERRLRLLPSQVVVYFVLAPALFEDCSSRSVWGKLVAGLESLALVRPAVSSLSRARQRIGAAPLRRLFETLAGPVAHRGQSGAFWRGLRTVAVDGTLLHTPDEPAITWRYPKRSGDHLEFGYPLLRDTAADTVVTGTGILPPPGPADLVGTIGRATLDALHPARHRHRVKARTRKNPTSKYGPNAGQQPTTSQNYTAHATVTFFEYGLANRSRP